jgi:aryl-alcohol dehydrogenase-like predicted oxidoreductase
MTMQKRTFGRSGMQLSILGFGCGAVGGLMVRGEPADQERAIARALDAGINYFDTAVAYGDGESEKNLGRILKQLKPADAMVGTKVRLRPADFARIADTVTASLDASLQRLRLERVDIFHFHNPITLNGGGDSLGIRQVLDELVPAFERQRQRGKTRFLGITAVGDSAALQQAIDARVFDSAQVSYNMLNPSAAAALPANYPAQDWWAFVCWPQAHSRAPPSAIRSPARRRSRSARPRATTPISRVRGGSCRWSRKDLPAACPRPPSASPFPTRPWARSWSAWPRRSSSNTRWLPCSKVRCHRPRSTVWQRCSRGSQARRAET